MNDWQHGCVDTLAGRLHRFPRGRQAPCACGKVGTAPVTPIRQRDRDRQGVGITSIILALAELDRTATELAELTKREHECVKRLLWHLKRTGRVSVARMVERTYQTEYGSVRRKVAVYSLTREAPANRLTPEPEMGNAEDGR